MVSTGYIIDQTISSAVVFTCWVLCMLQLISEYKLYPNNSKHQRVGSFPWFVHRITMVLSTLLLVRCVDQYGVWKIFPAGVVFFLTENTTSLIVCGVLGVIDIQMHTFYSVVMRPPRRLRTAHVSLFLADFIASNVFSVCFVLFDQQWTLGGRLLFNGLVLLSLAVEINISSHLLRRQIMSTVAANLRSANNYKQCLHNLLVLRILLNLMLLGGGIVDLTIGLPLLTTDVLPSADPNEYFNVSIPVFWYFQVVSLCLGVYVSWQPLWFTTNLSKEVVVSPSAPSALSRQEAHDETRGRSLGKVITVGPSSRHTYENMTSHADHKAATISE